MSGHSHGAPATAGPGSARATRALVTALCLTGVYLVVELIVGLASGSLALVSDAAHMGTDVLALSMALAAAVLARRAATSQRTFGLYRLEVIVATANGLLLIGVAVFVVVEAVRRFAEPVEVPGVPLLVVAAVGLVVNLVSFRLLTASARGSLGIRSAALEVLGDLLGSVGVIVAAVVVLATGWPYADPIVAIAIGLFILPRTVLLLRQTVRVLLEAAPPEIRVDELAARIRSLPGVAGIHDLHVWTITSGLESASGHVELDGSEEYAPVLRRILDLLRDDYGIGHATIQCEPRAFDEPGAASPV